MCWNGHYKETDKNAISSNRNINDDQQHITCQDDTIIMSKRHKMPPVTRNDDFLW